MCRGTGLLAAPSACFCRLCSFNETALQLFATGAPEFPDTYNEAERHILFAIYKDLYHQFLSELDPSPLWRLPILVHAPSQ